MLTLRLRLSDFFVLLRACRSTFRHLWFRVGKLRWAHLFLLVKRCFRLELNAGKPLFWGWLSFQGPFPLFPLILEKLIRWSVSVSSFFDRNSFSLTKSLFGFRIWILVKHSLICVEESYWRSWLLDLRQMIISPLKSLSNIFRLWRVEFFDLGHFLDRHTVDVIDIPRRDHSDPALSFVNNLLLRHLLFVVFHSYRSHILVRLFVLDNSLVVIFVTDPLLCLNHLSPIHSVVFLVVVVGRKLLRGFVLLESW